ncbi:hypothetical protein SALBM217S_01640 [Streptomyces griseoloalbus]
MSASVRPGAGASSITFWCLRWREQSRVPSAHTVPWVSARTCTSTWRPFSRYGSTNTSPSPKALAASARAATSSASRSARRRTTRMPRPPPPAAAFTSTGRSASVTSVSGSTPISCLARVLDAIASIASGGGPIHTRPASWTARAKSAFSERKP